MINESIFFIYAKFSSNVKNIAQLDVFRDCLYTSDVDILNIKMKVKYELMAVLAGSIVLFLTGVLIGEFILDTLQAGHTISYGSLDKEESVIWLGALAQVPVALLLTYVFSKHISALTINKGAIIGGLVCAMFNLSANLMILSRWKLIDGFVIATDFVGMVVWGAVGGAVIAWVLGFRKEWTSTE